MKTIFGKCGLFTAIFVGIVFLGCASFYDIRMTRELAETEGVRPYAPQRERRDLGVPFQFYISHGIRLVLIGEPPPIERAVDQRGRLIVTRHAVRNEVTIASNLPGVVPAAHRDDPNIYPRRENTFGPRQVKDPDGRVRLEIDVAFERLSAGRGVPPEKPTLTFSTRPFANFEAIPHNANFYLRFDYPRARQLYFHGALYQATLEDGRRIPHLQMPYLYIRMAGRAIEDTRQRRVRGIRV